MQFMSKSEGVLGSIKQKPQDFIVKEITDTGIALELNRHYTANELGKTENLEGKFATFVLQKTNWNTVQALIAIAKRLGRGKKSISYAGTKDREAVTVQLASIYGIKAEMLENIRIKDISINGAWQNGQVELGSNLGNAFEITISNCKAPENAEKVIAELNGKMPNYFGEQRFGMRSNNVEIGLHILRNELKEAAIEFLTNTTNEKNERAVEARKGLAETLDFERALEEFPNYLKPERSMLRRLAANSNDYAGALRQLPRGILIMFIHAVQSEIFNKELDQRMLNGDFSTDVYCDKNQYGFPDISKLSSSGEFPVARIIGYDTQSENQYEKEVMEGMQISKESFNIRSMPELSMKGSYRPLIVNIKNLKHSVDEEAKAVRLSFELPSGSYASVLLDEINKQKQNKNKE
ncbi:MAG: tRNA pseudouridine(13) synthase TruD [Candidatus Micrarchaeia archaeon]